MASPDLFDSNTSDASRLRKWIFLALLMSLLIHLGLVFVFNSTKLERFSTATERLVPRVFKMNRAVVDSTLLEETSEPPKPQTKPERHELEIPQDSPAFDRTLTEARAIPSPTELVKPIVSEKPKIGPADLKTLSKFQETARESMEKELSILREQALEETGKAASVNLAALAGDATASIPPGSVNLSDSFSTLDSLLTESGGLKEGTKPILLPTDLLFDFDKEQLRPQALSSLEKLGTLIKRNPKVTFSIEGHSDAFGTPERNQSLSLARAEAVRSWLINSMGVDPANVETKGLGSSKLLVQPDPNVTSKADPTFEAEVARQQLNRRVEIVMRWEQ